MIFRTVTTAEALEEVGRLIAQYRQYRGQPDAPGHRTYVVLKAVYAELQSEQPARVGEAQRELTAALGAMERSNAMNEGFTVSTQIDVALKTRAYWPTIRQALAFLEDARKVDAQ